jgi:hypothetical protein
MEACSWVFIKALRGALAGKGSGVAVVAVVLGLFITVFSDSWLGFAIVPGVFVGFHIVCNPFEILELSWGSKTPSALAGPTRFPSLATSGEAELARRFVIYRWPFGNAPNRFCDVNIPT